jgi:protoporphyrinogen IX oxidase
MLYNAVKAGHIIFVIALMAGLLIYPRYKIHQLSADPGTPLFDTMKDAALRLRRIIVIPSVILVWLFGLAMLYLNPGLLSAGWMQAKLALVIALSGFAGWFLAVGRRIDAGTGGPSVRHLRLLNEVPFILMIAVVILAVVEPF